MAHISIIGPSYPYRGGIAHHTNRLVTALEQDGNKIGIFTFKRQYPSFIYPGKNQFEPPGSANPLKKSQNLNINTLIDTINPFSWYFTALSIIKDCPDYCIIKYWHPYFVPCMTFIAWMIRRHKIPIICIVENLLPHERHLGDVYLLRIFFSQVDRSVTQSPLIHNQYLNLFPNVPEIMIPHPVYDQFGPLINTRESRQFLKINQNKKILLFFGFIRPYKGLDILLEAMPSIIEQHPDIHLMIAGECFGSYAPYQKIIDRLKISDYITAHIKYIPNEEVRYWFGASDLLVMPYRSITNSGIDSIGSIYANDSLLMVGENAAGVATQISNRLKSQVVNQRELKISWKTYVERLISWLN